MHDVTIDRDGPHINLQLKGTTKALHQAQQRLERCYGRDVSLEPDTTTYAETTNATYLQPQVTAHGTTGTPDKPADAATDKTTPHYHHTLEPIKEGKEVKERVNPADKHSESTTIHHAKPINKTKVFKGYMKANEGTYGFIKVEDGTDMFVLPSSCPNSGNKLIAIDTKVTFRTVIDTKTNKIRAEAVSPEGNSNPEATTSRRNDVRTHPQSNSSTKPIGA